MTDVVVVHGENRRENIKKVLRLLPEHAWEKLGSAQTILIKPNLVHHKNQLASTHVDAVRGVIDVIREKSQAAITIADASYHGTKAAFKHLGYENLLADYSGVELVDLNDDQSRPGYFMKQDGTKGEMGISARVLDADFTICLASLKTHRDVGVTLTMKNWTIGTWVAEAQFGMQGKYWPRWPYLHSEGQEAHNATIAELLHQHAPDLALIDGFIGMEGDGPTRGEPVESKMALAGMDCVAVDSIACELMGVNPSEIHYLAMARERGYGVGNREEIRLIGESDLTPFIHQYNSP